MKKFNALLLVVWLAILPSCRDAFTANVSVVARAGPWELTVDRLGEIFAQSKALAPRRDVVERVAHLWVDYSLYAQRAVAGDSMLDSAEVLAVVWPEVQGRRADHFHDALIASQVHLDSATVDSIYLAGDLRLIRHVLFRIESAMAPPARAAKKREAESASARLHRGGSWAEAIKKANGGSLGVVARGDLMVPVDSVAYRLAPGGMTEIVESPLGYHVVSRPALKDARAEFRLGVENRMVEKLDSVYLGAIAARRHFRVRGNAAARAREAIVDPMRSADSRAVLATFDGGTFQVRDLVRWVRSMPAQLQSQIVNADEAQLTQFIRQLMRNQAMMVEADSVGVTLTALDLLEFKDILRRDLAQLSKGLGIDATALPDSSPEHRLRIAAVQIDRYLEAVAANRTTFVAVPPFLAARLREKGDWRVVSAGIDRVLARAEVLKIALDSLKQSMDSGGTNARQ